MCAMIVGEAECVTQTGPVRALDDGAGDGHQVPPVQGVQADVPERRQDVVEPSRLPRPD